MWHFVVLSDAEITHNATFQAREAHGGSTSDHCLRVGIRGGDPSLRTIFRQHQVGPGINPREVRKAVVGSVSVTLRFALTRCIHRVPALLLSDYGTRKSSNLLPVRKVTKWIHTCIAINSWFCRPAATGHRTLRLTACVPGSPVPLVSRVHGLHFLGLGLMSVFGWVRFVADKYAQPGETWGTFRFEPKGDTQKIDMVSSQL